jgi:hypothetical protein
MSNGAALEELSLSMLQNTVRRANRLRNNLLSDRPRPVRTHTLSVEVGSRIFCIPGTNLVVTDSTGSLSCWDILMSQRVAHLEISDLRLQTGPCMELGEIALFGASIGYAMNLKCTTILGG